MQSSNMELHCQFCTLVNAENKNGGKMSPLKISNKVAAAYLTPNTPLIQLWCARSKLNMDEICSLNIHL